MHLSISLTILLWCLVTGTRTSYHRTTEDHCELSVICNLVSGDVSSLFTYDHTLYAHATTLAGQMKNAGGFKEDECGIEFSNCNAELMKFVTVKLNMTGKIEFCPWSTYPYMMFHCSTIRNWPTAALAILRPEHKTCNLLPDCKYAFHEFEKFNSKGLPADWNQRKENAAPATVRKVSGGWDNAYRKLPWQFCDPGSYVSEFYFNYVGPRGAFTADFGIGPYYDFGFNCTSFGTVEANIHGPKSQREVKNPDFFTGLTMITDSQHRFLRLYVLAFGVTEDDKRNVDWFTPLPSSFPLPKNDQPTQTTTQERSAFIEKYRPQYEFANILCPKEKVICGIQRSTDYQVYLASLRIYCCPVDYECKARTVFEVQYAVDLSNRQVGDAPGTVTFTRSESFVEGVSTEKGGSSAHTFSMGRSAQISTLKAAFSVNAEYTYNTERSWFQTISESKTIGRTISETRIPFTGCITSFYRAVGICGMLRVVPAQLLIEAVLPQPKNCAPSTSWEVVRKTIAQVSNVALGLKIGMAFTRPAISLVEDEPFLRVSEITRGLQARFESGENVVKLKTKRLPETLSRLVKPENTVISRGRDQRGLVYQQVGHCDDPFKNTFTVYTDYTVVLEYPKVHACHELWDEIRPILTPKNRPLIVSNFYSFDLEHTVETIRIGFYVPDTPSAANKADKDRDQDVRLPLPVGVSGGEEIAKELKKQLVKLGTSKNTSVNWVDTITLDWDMVKDVPGGLVVQVPPRRQLHMYEAVAHCDSYTVVLPDTFYEIKNKKICESSFGFEIECSYTQKKV